MHLPSHTPEAYILKLTRLKVKVMTEYRNPVQVSIYPFKITTKIEFLLMRRLPERGGFWQGVSGGVKKNENIMIAAKRELTEETGFEVSVQFINHYFDYKVEEKHMHLYAPDVNKIIDHAFIADVTNLGNPILSEEHDVFKWLDFENIDLRELKWAESKTALIKANEYIKKLLQSC